MLAFFFMRQTQHLIFEKETRAICRRELWTTQEKASEPLKKLLQLNAPMRALKIAKLATLAAIAAATASLNAPALAAATERLHHIESSISKVKSLQQFLLKSGKYVLSRGLIQTERQLKSRFAQERDRSLIQSLQAQILPLKSTSTWNIRLAVRPENESDPDPIYVLEENFSDKQSLQISWSYRWQIQKEAQKWLTLNWNFTDSCSATLESKNLDQNFQPRINEARFFLKPSFFF